MPAIAALDRFASVPAKIAFNPNFAISLLREGTRLPNPPSNIAIEEKFANPHNAKIKIAWLRTEKFSATKVNSFEELCLKIFCYRSKFYEGYKLI